MDVIVIQNGCIRRKALSRFNTITKGMLPALPNSVREILHGILTCALGESVA